MTPYLEKSVFEVGESVLGVVRFVPMDGEEFRSVSRREIIGGAVACFFPELKPPPEVKFFFDDERRDSYEVGGGSRATRCCCCGQFSIFMAIVTKS